MDGTPFNKTGVEMMSINSFVGLIKDKLLKEVS
ncbi:serine/threonine protein kinase, partial [Bacillus pseudomycoides]